MPKPFRLLLTLALLAGLAACTSPYAQNYRMALPAPGSQAQFLPPAQAPRLGSLRAEPREDILALFEQGYGVIGTASFTAQNADPAAALDQARKVGAEIVLVSSRYAHTVTGVTPVTTAAPVYGAYDTGYGYGGYGYDPGQIVYGPGAPSGYGPAYYATQTSYVPFSFNEYDHNALFFAPLARAGLGIWVESATPAQRQKAGTNQLLAVVAIRNQSPAFHAGILPGDLLLTIDGQPAYDTASFNRGLAASRQRPVAFALLRGGRRIVTLLQVPASW